MTRVRQLRDMQAFGNSDAGSFFALPGGWVWKDDGTEDGTILSPREWQEYIDGTRN